MEGQTQAESLNHSLNRLIQEIETIKSGRDRLQAAFIGASAAIVLDSTGSRALRAGELDHMSECAGAAFQLVSIAYRILQGEELPLDYTVVTRVEASNIDAHTLLDCLTRSNHATMSGDIEVASQVARISVLLHGLMIVNREAITLFDGMPLPSRFLSVMRSECKEPVRKETAEAFLAALVPIQEVAVNFTRLARAVWVRLGS